MSFDKNEEMLKEMLEKIIFNENRLNELKKIIGNLENGMITAREFREKIFIHKQETFQELLDFFPFYADHLQKSRSIDEFAFQVSEKTNSKELKERDNLLIEAYNRLVKIQESLKES